MMKRVCFVLIALCAALSSYAQNASDTKIQFNISKSSFDGQLDFAIVKGVYGFIVTYITENGYVLRPDNKTARVMSELDEHDEFFADFTPSMHTPVKGGDYSLGYEYTSEGNYRFVLTHTTRTHDSKQRRSGSYPVEWLRREEAQKLVAYELIKDSFGLNDEGKEELNDLLRTKDDFFKGVAERDNGYKARCFFPPVNQISSHVSEGTTSGIAVLTGYGVSVGTFLWSTASFKANKRKLEGVSIDLSEAEKAREHYRKQMDICRGGQIASFALLAGTYIYGVANALSNRALYQQNTDDTSLVPIPYDNGAGIALVYQF